MAEVVDSRNDIGIAIFVGFAALSARNGKRVRLHVREKRDFAGFVNADVFQKDFVAAVRSSTIYRLVEMRHAANYMPVSYPRGKEIPSARNASPSQAGQGKFGRSSHSCAVHIIR